MRNIRSLLVIIAVILLCACGSNDRGQVMDGDGMFQTFHYSQITQDEAKQMMELDDGHVIVDVRREDEYVQGHIPGAILIPNESIGDTPPKELPDYDQIILVYCRSGRRSKEASQKLADLGYSHVYEFGGIIDWKGEVTKGKFEEENGEKTDHEDMTPSAIVNIRVGDEILSVEMESNSSADAFFEKLKVDDISIEMHDYGSFEKVGDLPWTLPTNDKEISAEPGDLILYQGNKITVYYNENKWNFTKLGKLNATADEVQEVFGGKENITAEFFLEWTE